MEPKQNTNQEKPTNPNINQNSNVVKTKKVTTKKITKVTKSTSGNPSAIKKTIKSKNEVSVKNPEFQGESKVLPAQVQRQVLPNQFLEKQLPIKNTEQVNKQYQLKDIINETKTTINYHKALSTTIVKPVIVQEVVTRKPIIAPVDFRTPVNFFEGQPLNEEDLVIQNFFKNTNQEYHDATSEDLANSYLFNGSNNFLGQSVQYNYSQPQYNDYYNNNGNLLSQSVQLPNQKPSLERYNTIPTSSPTTIVTKNETTKTFVRPQVEKVQPKKITQEFNPKNDQKVMKKKKIIKTQQKTQIKKVNGGNNIAKSQVTASYEIEKNKEQVINKSLKPQEKVQNITVNNMLKATYPVLVEQKKIMENDVAEDDTDEKIPRDSIRPKK